MRHQARQRVHDDAGRRRSHGAGSCRVEPKAPAYFRSAQYDGDGKLTHVGTWLILDGPSQRGTGLGADATPDQKEQKLKEYLTEKHTAVVTTVSRDPSFILVDDVLALYAAKVAPKHARPWETAARIDNLKSFFGGWRLSQINGDTCEDYAEQRTTPAAARRELEDLRAAINYHRQRGLHDKLVSVVLPEKSERRERWLTRDEAAHLIFTAWRYKDDNPFERRSRRHVARFMLVARYMGSRASVICGASIEPKRPEGKPWIDLASGVFYGRGVGERETKKRKQLVRIPPPLLAHLRRWRLNGQRFAVEFRGLPVTRVSKGHRSAVAAAGLGPEVTPHIWRHTVATWLLQAGADPYKAAGFLAMSYETLMRVYGHHCPDSSAEVHGAIAAHRQRNVNDTRERNVSRGDGKAPEKPVKWVSSL
jgi:integrase